MDIDDIIKEIQETLHLKTTGNPDEATLTAIHRKLVLDNPLPSASLAPLEINHAETQWSNRIVADVASSSSFDPQKLSAAGIVMVLHRASLGMTIDGQFAKRRQSAKDAGLKYGLYMLPRRQYDPEEQLENTLSAIGTLPDDEKLIIDWEGDSPDLLPTFDQIVTMITGLQKAVGDAHPIIYGGDSILGVGNISDDEIKELANMGCMIWYARYRDKPYGLPVGIPPMFWQDACPSDAGCHNGMSPIPGNDGADYNRYLGTKEELLAKWPFRT